MRADGSIRSEPGQRAGRSERERGVQGKKQEKYFLYRFLSVSFLCFDDRSNIVGDVKNGG